MCEGGEGCDVIWITIAEWKGCVKEGRGGPVYVM